MVLQAGENQSSIVNSVRGGRKKPGITTCVVLFVRELQPFVIVAFTASTHAFVSFACAEGWQEWSFDGAGGRGLDRTHLSSRIEGRVALVGVVRSPHARRLITTATVHQKAHKSSEPGKRTRVSE